jgi:hypothetical protein
MAEGSKISRENSLTLHLRLKYSRDPSTPRPPVFREKDFFWRFAQDDRALALFF